MKFNQILTLAALFCGSTTAIDRRPNHSLQVQFDSGALLNIFGLYTSEKSLGENITNILSIIFADELKAIETAEDEVFLVIKKIPLACTILTAIKADAFPFCDPNWAIESIENQPEPDVIEEDNTQANTDDSKTEKPKEEKKPTNTDDSKKEEPKEEDSNHAADRFISDREATTGSISVYFGVGCFWHIQHELVEAERTILNRLDGQITALTGYAGSSQTGKDGIVCYHNSKRLALYGELGHGEAVNLNIPQNDYIKFAKTYFGFLDANGDRADKGDRGLDYRSMIGLPGGVSSPLFAELQAAAGDKVKLVEGKGGDPDTLGKKIVYVYDTKDFPFHQAEVYHQFHDGFIRGQQYESPYHNLVKVVHGGKIHSTGCPEEAF